MEVCLPISDQLLFYLMSALIVFASTVLTLRRLNNAERRKWWRQWKVEPMGNSRSLAFAAWICMVLCAFVGSVRNEHGLILVGIAFGVMATVILEDSIHRHIQKQAALRSKEMRHWEIRKPLEHRAAHQASMRLKELDRVQSLSLRKLMDPHFLFNALNGIMHDMMTKEWRRAIRHLKAFNRLAERQIQSGQEGWLTLQEEWNSLTDYLELEVRRLDRPIEWNLVPLHAELMGREIPTLLIQPLVENALWHGLGGTATSAPGTLTIEVRPFDDGHVCIEVTNSPTMQKTDSVHPVRPALERRDRRHASDLIRQRLRLLDRHGHSGFTMLRKPERTISRLIVPCS